MKMIRISVYVLYRKLVTFIFTAFLYIPNIGMDRENVELKKLNFLRAQCFEYG